MPNPNADSTHLAPYRFKAGQIANPKGRPKTAYFKRAFERVLLSKTLKDEKSVTVLRALLEDVVAKAQQLVNEAEDVSDLAQIVPLLKLISETLDGAKEVGDISGTKESRVILIGGKVDRTEEVLSVTETVRLETGNDEANN